MSYCSTDNFPGPTDLEVLFYLRDNNRKTTSVFKSPLDRVEDPVTKIRGINRDDFVQLIQNLFANDVCKGNIGKDFFEDKDMWKKNHLFMILLDTRYLIDFKGYNIGKPIGFIIGHLDFEDDLGKNTTECYLELICSCPKTGHFLLKYFILFSESRGYDAVSLSSLDNVLTYYSRFGFQNRHSCNVPGEEWLIPGPEVARDLMLPEYRGKATEDIPSLYEYMERLRLLGFGKQDDGCDPKVNVRLTPIEYKTHLCHNNGYKMRKCLKEPVAESKKRREASPVPMRMVLRSRRE